MPRQWVFGGVNPSVRQSSKNSVIEKCGAHRGVKLLNSLSNAADQFPACLPNRRYIGLIGGYSEGMNCSARLNRR